MDEERILFGMNFNEISMISAAKKIAEHGLIFGDADFTLSKELMKLQEIITKPILTKKPMGEREFFMKLIGYAMFKLKELDEIEETIKEMNCFYPGTDKGIILHRKTNGKQK